jgi:parvulin-like peptidyl-prolyl isomerase
MKTAFLAACLLCAATSWAQAPAKPLITNGPVSITSDDFEAYLLRVPEEHRSMVRASMENITKILEGIYTNRVLAEEAKKVGLDKDPKYRLRMQQLEEAFLAQAWADYYAKSLKVPDLAARAEEMYKLDKTPFTEPERANGRHIVISLLGRTREMAIARANEVIAKAKGGESFEALAREYTDDPNFGQTKGRLEEVTAKVLEKPFADALFALKPGEISQPVETKTAVHVIWLDGKIPSRVKPFAEVKEALIEAERDKYRNITTDRRIGELKNTSQTQIHEANIRGLVVDIDRAAIERAIKEHAAGSPAR